VIARMTFATLAFTTVLTIQPHAANAAPRWPWCSQYFSRSTSHACAFRTWQQCMDTVQGIGGYCYANPYPQPPASRSAKSSHHHAARG
jgi:hypothetical protein